MPIAPLVKTLRAWLRRHDRWQALCAAVTRDADGNTVIDAAFHAWSVGCRTAPSKASKWRAYDAAERLRSILELDVPHPADVAGLRVVLAAAEARA